MSVHCFDWWSCNADQAELRGKWEPAKAPSFRPVHEPHEHPDNPDSEPCGVVLD